jgi:hypothetical protein
VSATAVAVCLILGAKTVSLDTQRFTLAWTHSVEKIEWQEDYVLRDGRIELVEARIAGTGAGMEPPQSAILRDGVWHYAPALPPLDELRLTLSPYVADYRLCWDGVCYALGTLVDSRGDPGVVTLHPCPGN